MAAPGHRLTQTLNQCLNLLQNTRDPKPFGKNQPFFSVDALKGMGLTLPITEKTAVSSFPCTQEQ